MHLLCFLISIYKADNIYILFVLLILWFFASDTASVIQPDVIEEDFGSSVISVNQGIFLSVFEVITYAFQSVVGVVYQAHVPEGSTNCFGLICFHETFGMGIGVSLLSLSLVTLYSYFRHRLKKWMQFCYFVMSNVNAHMSSSWPSAYIWNSIDSRHGH